VPHTDQLKFFLSQPLYSNCLWLQRLHGNTNIYRVAQKQ